MNITWLEKVCLELAILTALLLSKVFGQDNYGYNYGGGSYSYGVEDYQYQVEDGLNTIQCYSCHYHVKQGVPEGMANCDDPFNELEIPAVACPGMCGKLRHAMTDSNPDDYMVIRNCIPGCKERSNDEKGNYQTCCSEELCNGANGTVVPSVTCLTILTGLLCLVISVFVST